MKEIRERLQANYGLEVTSIEPLVGEVNKNFLVRSEQGTFIYKETPADRKTTAFSRDETRLLDALSGAFPGRFQRPLTGKDGKQLYDGPEGRFQFRLLEYIEGDLLNGVEHTFELFRSFGKLLAQMDQCLMQEHCPEIQSRPYDWDNVHFDLNMKHVGYISNPADRRLVEYFHMQFHEQVVPHLPGLRRSLIHNDANDYNVVVGEGQIKGIIDLGDSVHSLLINELAVALSYTLMDKEDPLAWAVPLIEAYAGVLPLEEKEADLLYYLVGTRLSISILHSSLGRHRSPENKYLTISEAPVIRLLHKWISISPRAAATSFRDAASLPVKKGVDIQDELEQRGKHLSGALSISYKEPLYMEQSAFQYMYDSRGQSYLDLRNNIPHVGHCHPTVVKAGQAAMARLNTNTRYLYDSIHRYSEKLLSHFPEPLNKVFYLNSGSAATDLALRLARTFTGRQKMLVMEHGYHGNSSAAIDVSHCKFSRKGGKGTPVDTLVTPIPLCGSSQTEEEKGVQNLEQLREYLESISSEAGQIAGFITEPIVSAAGQVVIDRNYTEAISSFIREQGGVYISDEVQTGFGRLGRFFWGYELSGVVPDIVILGKPIANGHPMAAVVCTEKIARSFENGMEFFSSFGGNPVSCAIAEAVLDVIKEEKLAENAEMAGTYLVGELNKMSADHPFIGEVRGWGLSLGFEIMDPSDPSKPGTKLAHQLTEQMKGQGFLVGTDGPFDNIFKLKPPLCFSQKNAADFLDKLSMLIAMWS